MARLVVIGGRYATFPGIVGTAATALHAGFTLEDLLYLDQNYAPPFAGV